MYGPENYYKGAPAEPTSRTPKTRYYLIEHELAHWHTDITLDSGDELRVYHDPTEIGPFTTMLTLKNWLALRSVPGYTYRLKKVVML